MQILLYVWLIASAVFFIIEYVNQKAVFLWFGIGGIVSAILSGVSLEWYYQVGAFVVVSVVLTLSLRKPVLNSSDKSYRGKLANSVIGKEFELLTPITLRLPGTVKIADTVFEVLEQNGNVLAQNTTVEVVEYKNQKLIVKKIKD